MRKKIYATLSFTEKSDSITVFNRIVGILEEVPDEHLHDVMFYYFKSSKQVFILTSFIFK